MMVRVPTILEASSDSRFIVEAVYYVVRALRNSLRGYQKVEVSTEPSAAARRLAEKAIREIEEAEQKDVTNIGDPTIMNYISELQAFLDKITPSSGSAIKKAEKTLQQMRGQR
jgi:hypothetical protein